MCLVKQTIRSININDLLSEPRVVEQGLLIRRCVVPRKGIGCHQNLGRAFGMHSRDAYPQFADVWVQAGYFSVFRSMFLQLLRGI